MPFNMFPYTNLHNLNLDWILNIVKTMAAAVEAAAGTVESYAARLTQVETDVETITPAATGAVRHDVSQSLDTGNRRRAATNIHVVSYDSTVLTSGEKQQARTNIGAADASTVTVLAENISALENSRVSYAAAQTLTDGQKAQARSNIGAAAAGDIPQPQAAVLYTEQSLSSGQQQQARSNIGAAAASAIPDVSDVVRYSSQSLTTGQKSQARENIGAADGIVVEELEDVVAYNIIINETATDVFSITGGNLEDARGFADEGVVIITLNTLLNGVIRGVANFTDLTSSSEISAVLTQPASPGPGVSTGYRVLISNNGTNDVLILTSFEYKLMPSCTSSDRGKILTVSSTGQPVWEDKGPLVVTFSGTSAGGDAACDKTWAEIQAAGNNIVARYYDSSMYYYGIITVQPAEVRMDHTRLTIDPDTYEIETYTTIVASISNMGEVYAFFDSQ